jgi:archaeosine synthase beta-subunit
VSLSAVDQRIRSLRPPKPLVDPYRAHGNVKERERRPGGVMEDTLTVFLAGAECPFTCSFCDLWRWTIDGPTPAGALATQLEAVLSEVGVSGIQRLKLYNASNFFDSRAVPREDVERIAALAQQFGAVTVESHASTVGAKALEFAATISGRLEVAIGLETIHPRAAEQSNKRLDLERFDRAAEFLAGNGIDLRVFVLLGAPYVPAMESMEWTIRTVEHAVHRGAALISIIPVRGGNGELERLQLLGEFTPPTLGDLETALDRCSRFSSAVVTADLWDIQQLITCESCCVERIARLRRINDMGAVEARVTCKVCGGS